MSLQQPGLALSIRQWKALLAIYWQDGLAYRAQGFIWLLTDVVTAIIMPQVWIAAGKGQAIQGFTPGDFVVYYLFMLLLTSFITSHFMWDISYEIREGIIANHLVRPISYFQFTFVRNLAWRTVRAGLFLPLMLMFGWFYLPHISNLTLYPTPQFFLAVILGHTLSLTFVLAMSMIALFTQEAQSIFELYYAPFLFLSGQIFPVDIMPVWVKSVALWTPFYYTVAAPTEMLIGKITPDKAWPIILAQIAWIAGSYLLYRVLFQAGMKRYASVGL